MTDPMSEAPVEVSLPPMLQKNGPFSLLDFNGAEENLRDILPRAKIEYLAIGDAPPDFKKGLFSFSLGYQKEEIQVVLLAMKFGRVMFPPFTGEKNVEPLCRSNNGLHSTAGSVYPLDRPMTCQSCKFGEWSENTPPVCAEVYSLLLWDIEDDLPFVIGVKRTSIMPLRKLKTALKMSAKKWAYPGCAPNACVSMLMRTKAIQNYYILEFPQRNLKGNWLWQRLPEDQAKELTKLAMDLSTPFTEIDVRQVVDVESEAEKVSGDIPF